MKVAVVQVEKVEDVPLQVEDVPLQMVVTSEIVVVLLSLKETAWAFDLNIMVHGYKMGQLKLHINYLNFK